MRTVIAAVAGAALLFAGPACAGKEYYAAIVIDNAGKAYASVNRPSEWAARTAALHDCGERPDCDLVLSWANGCGAVVYDGADRWDGDVGATLEEARTKALERLGGKGSVVKAVCTR